MTRAPAARADATPAGASSTTAHRDGGTPSHSAARRQVSGAGFPLATSSAVTSTAGEGSPTFASRVVAVRRVPLVAGSAKEFLGLMDEEEAVIDLKLALARAVREERAKRQLTQIQLGRLLGSSQSRIAKMEAGDSSVSIDLFVRSLLRMGASRRDLVRWLARPARKAA
jgi:DNA-binding XRE family transcriptional regulator